MTEVEKISSKTPFLRQITKWTGIVLTSLLVIFLASWLYLRSESGKAWINNLIVDQVEANLNATLSISKINGNLLTHVRFIELNLVQEDTALVTIDTLDVWYSPWAALWGTIEIRALHVKDPAIFAIQNADNIWNLSTIVPESPPSEEPLGWVVKLNELTIDRGNLSAQFYTSSEKNIENTVNTDSTILVDQLTVRFDDFVLEEESFTGKLNQFTAQVQPANTQAQILIEAGGALSNDAFQLKTLSIQSDESNVTAGGYIPFGKGYPHKLNFELNASPFSLRDIQTFLPETSLEGDAQVSLSALGKSDLIELRADANFDGGTSLNFEALLSPKVEGDLSYSVTAALREFNLANFTGNPADETLLRLNITAGLFGNHLENLSGNILVDVLDSQWNNQNISAINLNIPFENGAIFPALEAHFSDSKIAITGAVHPFDEVPTWQLDGAFDQIDAAYFLADEPVGLTDISGHFSAGGTGFDLEKDKADLKLHLDPSSAYGAELDALDFSTALSAGHIDLALKTQFPEGSFTTEAWLRPFEESFPYAITAGRFDDLNFAEILSDPSLESLVSGSFSLEGTGVDPEKMLSRAVFITDTLFIAGLDLPRIELSTAIQNQQIQLELDAYQTDGRIHLIANALPLDSIPTFAISELHARRLNVGEIMQDTALVSDLNLDLVVTGSASPTEAPQSKAQLDIFESTIAGYTLNAGSVLINLERHIAKTSTILEINQTTFDFPITVNLANESPTLTLRQGSIKGLNTAIWAGSPEMVSDINLILNGEVAGTDISSLIANFDADLTGSTVNDVPLTTSALNIGVQDEVLTTNISLSTKEGIAELTAVTKPFADEIVLQADAFIQNLDVAALAGLPDSLNSSVTLSLSVDGIIQSDSTTISGNIYGESSQFANIKLDTLSAEFTQTNNGITLDTLQINSNLMALSAGGFWAFETNINQEKQLQIPNQTALSLNGEIKSLTPLASLVDIQTLGGRGSFNAEIKGDAQHLTFLGDAHLEQTIYEEYRVGQLYNRINAEIVGDSLRYDFRADGRQFSMPGFDIEHGNIRVSQISDSVSVVANVKIDAERDLGLYLAAPVSFDTVLLDSINLDFGADRWKLLAPTEISLADGFNVRQLLLHADEQQIAVAGGINFNGDQNLIVTIEKVRAGAFTDFAGFKGLDATIEGYVFVDGPAESPIITGSVDLLNIETFGRPAGALGLELNYADLNLNIKSHLSDAKQGAISLFGDIPIDLSLIENESVAKDATISLNLNATHYQLDGLKSFIDKKLLTDLGGQLNTVEPVQILGTLEAPELSGQIFLTDGRLQSPDLGPLYSNINGSLTLDGNIASIDTLSMQSGRGSAGGTGAISFDTLPVGNFDLWIEADNFLAMDSPTFQNIVVSTEKEPLAISGTMLAPALSGRVILNRGDIYLTDELVGDSFEEVVLTDADLAELHKNFGLSVTEADTSVFDFYTPLALDMYVVIERDVWMHSRSAPQMDIEFKGRLSVDKTAGEAEQVVGVINALPGRSTIQQFGRRFDLSTGKLTFNGDPLKVLMDIDAEYKIKRDDVTITLSIDGDIDDMKIVLNSDPELSTTDMVSYIAIGRPAASAQGALSGTQLGVGVLAGFVEGFASSNLGLDVVQIEQGETNATDITLTVGKYITNKVYTSFKRPLNSEDETTTEVTIEYELFDWMLLKAFGNKNNPFGLSVLWEYQW